MNFLGNLIYTEHSEVIYSLLKYFLEKAEDSRSTSSFKNWVSQTYIMGEC